MSLSSHSVTVTGCVQGVGFRPFVANLALENNLTGEVKNTTSGVKIHIAGTTPNIQQFLVSLKQRSPSGARIDTIFVEKSPVVGVDGFRIGESELRGQKPTQIPPDTATCHQCIREMTDKSNRRYHNPFITCTQCGPRFSLIEKMPFDRCHTTMADFTMCDRCHEEYQSPGDRRFHSQTNQCQECGPLLQFWDGKGLESVSGEGSLDACVQILGKGGIIAVKGVGGFQLLCDATNRVAIRRLRKIKLRPEKPFAILVAHPEYVHPYVHCCPLEQTLLTSPAAPIVLLKNKKGLENRNDVLVQAMDDLVGRLSYLGVMLPPSGLHYLLATMGKRFLVVTSANLPQEPMILSNREVLGCFRGKVDGFLLHNRRIVHRLDDSVVKKIGNAPVTLRLARGLAPMYKNLKSATPSLALGGHSKASIACGNDESILVGQHLGDLDSVSSVGQALASVEKLSVLHQFRPKQFICDSHPDYGSHSVADQMQCPKHLVGHHRAHLWGCLAEHDFTGKALGLSWDGLGLGDDNQLWGGEVFQIDPSLPQGMERIASLYPIPLLGGDRCALEPWRIALAMTQTVFWGDYRSILQELSCDRFIQQISPLALKLLGTPPEPGQHPETSSLGRLFDGVASLLDVLQVATFEGQAAMLLEACCWEQLSYEPYDLVWIQDKDGVQIFDWRPMVEAICQDMSRGVGREVVATRFHQTLCELVVCLVRKTGHTTVVASGGVFQNRFLTETLKRRLSARRVELLTPKEIPPNDGGLAFGQLVEAMTVKGGHHVSSYSR